MSVHGSDGAWMDAEGWVNGGRTKMVEVTVEVLTATSREAAYADEHALEIRLILIGTGASFSAIIPTEISTHDLDDFQGMVKQAHKVIEETLRRIAAQDS